ncbi:protein prenylyltransferase [Suhomyces tanzawaensis NRRL Y-17324]|uniref:Geranylgeranyl transferase type-2 subunit alpha n=1 Tax=Suhomyces tanzawaensis NRRL Y-17324 TaxID=984487 RepID=A0A1E4SLK5_9ASCO|nr:protein prenylyltransferase [Suhomyces tanzawaensis NRRL Y-17324]ODV80389.1 protein prenylyltransferase [Suhomyces tanzawaensis NRRL Y-17324]
MTTQLLMKNPEFYTIWNYRREVLLHNQGDRYQQLLEDDLKLLMGLLKRYPKCYWIWHHRKWCLLELVKLEKVSWAYEFAVVSKLLEMDTRNYHGWQYRRYVVGNIENEQSSKLESSGAPKSEVDTALLEINIKEFEYTTAQINKNISNFSAWHNRSNLIPKIFKLLRTGDGSKYPQTLELFQRPYTLLMHELKLVKTGTYVDTNDSSVWLYFYWLLTEKLFVEDLRSGENEMSYLDVLDEQLLMVEELNMVETFESDNQTENCWCLKTIILIKGLIQKEKEENDNLLTDDIKECLKKLIELDPLRKGKYLDQLAGKAAIIPV